MHKLTGRLSNMHSRTFQKQHIMMIIMNCCKTIFHRDTQPCHQQEPLSWNHWWNLNQLIRCNHMTICARPNIQAASLTSGIQALRHQLTLKLSGFVTLPSLLHRKTLRIRDIRVQKWAVNHQKDHFQNKEKEPSNHKWDSTVHKSQTLKILRVLIKMSESA